MKVKSDCFAFHDFSRSGCRALVALNCERCPFYKNKAEAQASQKKAQKRLQRLDTDLQHYIAYKYNTKIW